MVIWQSPLPWVATTICPAGASSATGGVACPPPVCTVTASEFALLPEPVVERDWSGRTSVNWPEDGSRFITWQFAIPPAGACAMLPPLLVLVVVLTCARARDGSRGMRSTTRRL